MPKPQSAPLGGFSEGVLAILASVRYAITFYYFLPIITITSGISALFLVMLLRFALRRNKLAYGVALLLFTLFLWYWNLLGVNE